MQEGTGQKAGPPSSLPSPLSPLPSSDDDEASRSTHRWMLMAAVARTMDGLGPVLELGCGVGSTPFLHELLQGSGRGLLSCDNNAAWLAEWAAKLQSDWHTFVHVPDWIPFAEHAACHDGGWAVALIDQAPGEMRGPVIDRIRNACQVIVVHDTEGPDAGLRAAFDQLHYRFDDRRRRPNTTVLSNVDDLRWLV